MTNLDAGRELDALVAERVMGWTRLPITPEWTHERWRNPADQNVWLTTPHYSESIAAAWQVVERLQQEGFDVAVTVGGDWPKWNHLWFCRIGGIAEVEEAAPSVSLAICRAALAAVGGQA